MTRQRGLGLCLLLALVGGALGGCSASIGLGGSSSGAAAATPDDMGAITQSLAGLTPTVDECVEYGQPYCPLLPEDLGMLTWPASSTADYQAFLQDVSSLEQMGNEGVACLNPEYSSLATDCVQPTRTAEGQVVVSAFNQLRSDFGLVATTMPPMPT